MKKTSKSEMFKAAHALAKATVNNYGGCYSVAFSESLRLLYSRRKIFTDRTVEWDANYLAKQQVKDLQSKKDEGNGLVRVHYSDYKKNYSNCATVKGSYDSKSKYVTVYTLGIPAQETVKMQKRSSVGPNRPCRFCGGYCYGDCRG